LTGSGQIVEAARRMGQGRKARRCRVVWQYKFSRHKHDDKSINALMDKAERVAAGEIPLKRTRFLKVAGATKTVDQALIDRARRIAGLKGYVTNVPASQMTGQQVVDAYNDLYQVELSFRMAKSDLKARTVFHHLRDSIETHLTIVFAALAVSRRLQAATGVTIKKLVQTLRPVRSAVVETNGQRFTIDPDIPPPAQRILDAITATGH
jgi:transposase